MPTLANDLVIVPEEFIPHVVEYSTKKSALVQSGIIEKDSAFDAKAKLGGITVTMPFWNDIDNDSQVVDDTVDTTVYNIGQSGDIAVKLMRENAWGASDLSAALAGDDPVARLASLIGNYWIRDDQRVLMNILAGVFASNAANNSSDLILDIAAATQAAATSANMLTGTSFIDAKGKLGDAADSLTACIMHSVPFSNLEKQNMIEYVQVQNSDGTSSTITGGARAGVNAFPTFLGRRIIVDDTCPVTAITGGYKYTSYLFGAGAIAMGEGSPKVPMEIERTPKRGLTSIFYRRDYIMHPRGVKFTSNTITGETPSNANLALAANWLRVWEKKNIKIVKMVTNG